MLHKLLLKIHNKTGLRYLCYTRAIDHNKYRGSGVQWKKHLSKNGNDVTTFLLCETSNIDYLSKLAVYISVTWDIINSDVWANLQVETCNVPVKDFVHVHSEETKQKISEASKSMKRTKEHYEKVSKALTGRKGKSPSSETRLLISKSSKGRIHTEYSKQKISKNHSKIHKNTIWITDGIFETHILLGNDIPNGWRVGRKDKDYSLSKEHKEKLSIRLKGKIISKEQKIKMSENNARANKGKIWINDGNNSMMIFSSEIIPDGWSKGRIGNFLFQNGWR